MLSHYVHYLVCAAAVLNQAQAQKSVPQDLSHGFDITNIAIQANFGGEASEGFADGTKFTAKQVASAPNFALGDSSGISTTALYTIMMIDTTCDNARTLHFLQTDFAYDGTLVDLASSTAPLQSYQAPGAFKETGDGRKYTFLLYGQPENKNVSSLKLPSQGDVFMVKNFEDQNGYIDPQAGIGMVVDLGGTVNCGAAQSGGVNSVAQTAAASSAIASSGGAPSAAPSSAAPSAVSSASLASQVTPSISFESPSSTSRSVSSTAGPKATSVSSGVVAASSVLVGGASGTTLAMSGKTTATGTVSGTAAAATQTGSEASSMSLAIARCVVVASLIAFAGLLAY